jgi:succinate dehydrogenase/fumarate reductase-like Fe-S protein
MTFSIIPKKKTSSSYRWGPDSPRADISVCCPMVLDTLIKFKNELDMSLPFHRSCREG